jgi:uncharacterized protein involved in type VI secretion and phage assembly
MGGEGYGARFHPRVGEIVVIDFFEGMSIDLLS